MSTHQELLGKRLTALRKKSGMSMKAVERRVYDLLGAYAPTHQTLANYHNGKVAKPDFLILLALTEVYECNLSEIDPALADQLLGVRDLLVPRITCVTTSAAA